MFKDKLIISGFMIIGLGYIVFAIMLFSGCYSSGRYKRDEGTNLCRDTYTGEFAFNFRCKDQVPMLEE